MSNNPPRLDIYPWVRILPRWILGISEIGLSIYFLITFNSYLGLFFSAYWVFSLFVLLPLIRCSNCYYYGKRCNTAWGLLAGIAFPRGEQVYFQAGYGMTVLLWPLRIIPVGVSLINLLNGFKFVPDGLFIIYLIVIIIHRLYYRASSCRVCHQKETCPVYDPRVLAEKVQVQK